MNESRRPRRRLLTGALLATAALVAGVSVAQGSLAYWNDAEASEGITVTSGTASLEVTAPVWLSSTVSAVYPGSSSMRFGNGAVENTGTVPLAVTVSRVSADAFAEALVINVGLVQGDCQPGTPLTSTTATLATLDPGDSYTLCASASLPLEASVGVSATTSVTLTVTGVQP
ncbi:hypothetical protein [Microbacterium sp.]|uniref:hypothetical protein n=1 Tax=unclassified Microbacterium TaxID=2609290 RepID=UPI002606F9E0|nr:hypothetical protein [Microbacterium sp.]